jgi:peptide/nickel transport system ATP-binding protein
MTSPVLEVSKLSVGYVEADGSINTVVWGADLALYAGTITGLAGESGCGKSTTALASIGYRGPNTKILQGAALLNGIDLLSLPMPILRGHWGKRVAYIPQGASAALNPAIRVGHQLAQPLAHHLGLSGRALRARQLELFDAVGIPSGEMALQRYPHQFSGGQQQRIVIAISLSCMPSVLILDEPTTGQDVTTQAQIVALIRTLVKESGVAALLVSHDLILLESITDRISIMYGGQIVESGEAADIYRRPRHPYTQALIRAVPDVDHPKRLMGIAGRPPVAVMKKACPFSPRCPKAISACTDANPELSQVEASHLVRCPRVSVSEDVSFECLPRIFSERSPQTPLMRVEQISCKFVFRGLEFKAVSGVSFGLASGETLGIVGESGSGKSTLLRAIAGLHAPASGRITFDGTLLASRAAQRSRALCGAIQLVFQDPESSLNPRHSVANIVGRSIRMFRPELSRSDELREAQRWIDAVKLPPSILHRVPGDLSGGQKQRIALARAFAARPKLLLCDEVTSALDVSVQATVLELIKELSHANGTAVIFVSHDLAVVRSTADHALVMRKGEVCEAGDIETLFTRPANDYTRLLLASLPRVQPVVHSDH